MKESIRATPLDDGSHIEISLTKHAQLSDDYQNYGFSVSAKGTTTIENEKTLRVCLNEKVTEEFMDQLGEAKQLIKSISAGMKC